MTEMSRRDTALPSLEHTSLNNLSQVNMNASEKAQQFVETTGLSIDGKTIFSSSSGPTSPEEGSPRLKTCDSPSTQSPLGFQLDMDKKLTNHSADSINSSSSFNMSNCPNSYLAAFQQVAKQASIGHTMDSFKDFAKIIQAANENQQNSNRSRKNACLIPSPDMLSNMLKSKKSLYSSHEYQTSARQFENVQKHFNDEMSQKDSKYSSDSINSYPTRKSLSPLQQSNDMHKSSPTSSNHQNGNILMDNIESWRQFQQAAYAHNLDPHVLAMYQNTNFPSNGNGSTRRKNATRETTSMLKAWLNEHRKNPYPTKGEKIMLAIITKMSLTQVSTWFANARRRLKKENKVTWAIRTCPTDGDDDLDSIPDDEEPNLDENLDEVERLSSDKSDSKKRPLSPNDKSSFVECSSKYSKTDHDRKIWSLVEMTQKEEEEKSPKYKAQREQLTSTPISKPFYSTEHQPKPDITSWLNANNQRNFSHPQSTFLPPPPSAFFSPETTRQHPFPPNTAECANRDFPPSQPNSLMPPFSMSSLLVAASAMNNMMNFDNLLPNDLRNPQTNEKTIAEKFPFDGVPNSFGKFEAMLKNSMRQNGGFDYKQIFNNRPKTAFNQSNMLSAFKNPVGLSKNQESS